ncbi:MAG: hypothetical protein J6J36_07000 [Clostridia bacterium]|nr:hypothetical protein [Clostridia bacterium]
MYKEKLEEVTFGLYLGVIYNRVRDTEKRRKYFHTYHSCVNWIKCFKSTNRDNACGLIYEKITENQWNLLEKIEINGKFGYFLTKKELEQQKQLFLSNDELDEIQIKMEF